MGCARGRAAPPWAGQGAAVNQFPATSTALVAHIQQVADSWRVPWRTTVRPDKVWCLWLDGADQRAACATHELACVTDEHGKLWVNLNRGRYFFELTRLHEDYPRWSWRKQIAEKSWASAADLALIDALVMFFPSQLYAAAYVEKEPRT